MPPQKISLMTPGPTPVPKETLEILSRPPIHHRTEEFEASLRSLFHDLKTLFATSGHVFVLTATGTGAMEASLLNVVTKSSRVLAVVGGYFGSRWADMAEHYGANVTRLNVQEGSSLAPDELADFLKTESPFDHFLLHAVETSTGTQFPINGLISSAKKHSPKALFHVDGITGVGAMDINMDRDEIDILLGGSQKAFSSITGLCLIGASPRALVSIQNNHSPSYYFDLKQEWKSNQSHQMRFSAPVNQVEALLHATQTLLSTPNRLGIFQKRAELTQTVIKSLGFQIFSQFPAPSVTAFCLGSSHNHLGKTHSEVLKNLRNQHGVQIIGGQGNLKGKILRVGQMGDIRKEDFEKFLRGLAFEVHQESLLPELQHTIASWPELEVTHPS